MLAESMKLTEHEDMLTILMTLPLLPESRFQEGFANAESLGHTMQDKFPDILKLLSSFRADWLLNKEKLMFEDENKDHYKILRIYESKLTVMFDSENLLSQWKYFGI